MKSFFIILIICVCPSVYSQKYSEPEKVNIIRGKGIEISNVDLKNLNDYDFDLIKGYNFDPYRNEKTDRKIQLVRGPLAIVKSFNFCKENQISYDEKVAQLKANEIVFKNVQTIITQVNIGLGYKQNELNSEKY